MQGRNGGRRDRTLVGCATTTISTRNTAESKLARLFHTFRMELRRAIELMGASYRNGPLPTL